MAVGFRDLLGIIGGWLSAPAPSLATLQKGSSVTPYVPVEYYTRHIGRTTDFHVVGHILTDANATFLAWGIDNNWYVVNRTTGATTIVYEVSSETELTVYDNGIFTAEGQFYTLCNPFVRIDNLGSKQRIEYPLGLTYFEEPYGSEAVIEFNNADGAFDSYNLVGKWIKIGRGIDNQVRYPGYLVCTGQTFKSTRGSPRDTYKLYCKGGYSILNDYLSPYTYFFNQSGLNQFQQGGETFDLSEVEDMTGRQIVAYILRLVGMNLGSDISLDDHINTWKPKIRMDCGINGIQMMLSVLLYFQCALLFREDYAVLVHGNTGNNYSYSCPSEASSHPFTDGIKQSTTYKPMKVKVDSLDGQYTGEYAATGWTPSMGYEYWVDSIDVVTSNDDCQDIAEAEILRVASQAESGMLILPIANCTQELYDPVTIVDNRGNISDSGVVGGIYFYYSPEHPNSEKRFCMEIRLGGLQRASSTGMQNLVNELSLGLTTGIPGKNILPHSISPEALRQTIQSYTSDIVWTSTGITNATWGAGTIAFADGSTLAIDAGSKSDLSATHLAYFIEGNSTIQWTTDWTIPMGASKGLLAMVIVGVDPDTKSYIKVVNGRQDVLNYAILYANMIIGEYIAGSTITADKLLLQDSWYDEAGVLIDKDTGIDIHGADMAFTTSKLVGTSITSVASSDAGTTITCTTASAHGLTTGDKVVLRGMSIAAYDGKYACTVIDADEFKVTVAYSSTATGYVYQVQCSVNSDGEITAGAGEIILNNDSISISNDGTDHILFKSGGVPTAQIGGSGDDLDIGADGDFTISAGGYLELEAVVIANGDILPVIDKVINLGSDSYAFDNVYADDFVNKSPQISYQEYLPLLDGIMVKPNGYIDEKSFPIDRKRGIRKCTPDGESRIGLSGFIELTLMCLVEMKNRLEVLEGNSHDQRSP